MVALSQPQLTREITAYDHRIMRELLAVVERVQTDDALESGPFFVERAALANGYEFFALHVNGELFGIADIRGNLRKVQLALTAYLWWLGFRATTVEWIEYGARAPKARPTWRWMDGEWVLDVWKPRDLPKLFEVE